ERLVTRRVLVEDRDARDLGLEGGGDGHRSGSLGQGSQAFTPTAGAEHGRYSRGSARMGRDLSERRGDGADRADSRAAQGAAGAFEGAGTGSIGASPIRFHAAMALADAMPRIEPSGIRVRITAPPHQPPACEP
ncbi:MAG: hypothetical protein ACKORL_13400, partial [Phycisphaerales bacterium]